ncbi:hypothetical protein AVEN_243457-1 [Araneus ventricosus]|uniref:Uncharacterized protein n=1 Tax=Araneus ventricosus TaxID=182803 RepID=A0A4Y2RX63_ARAVE|nr:hypothetical protein AVEN_243457-1 [Araneus ventricosus]
MKTVCLSAVNKPAGSGGLVVNKSRHRNWMIPRFETICTEDPPRYGASALNHRNGQTPSVGVKCKKYLTPGPAYPQRCGAFAEDQWGKFHHVETGFIGYNKK